MATPEPLDGPPILDEEVRKALEAAGWEFGDAENFLGLTEEERRLVSEKMARSKALDELVALSQEMGLYDMPPPTGKIRLTAEEHAELERHRREMEEDESWDPEEIGGE